MKRIIYILFFALALSPVSFAQDMDDDPGGKLREKMVEYIQKKLTLSRNEAEKFQPVFLDYLRQMRSTRQEFKTDQILLKKKVADLRVRTRDQLKPIIGEQRSNEVFTHEQEFIRMAIQEQKERIQNRNEGRANKKTRMLQ
ncbi:MAG: hypothetical protein ACXWV0_02435 [Flavisolibacter sp.]